MFRTCLETLSEFTDSTSKALPEKGFMNDVLTSAVFPLFITNWNVANTIARQAMYVLRNNDARLPSNSYSRKTINIKYYVCLALLIQHAQRMRRIISSFGLYGFTMFFSILSQKREDFQRKVIEHKTCVLIFSIMLVWSISHSKKNSEKCYHKCA